MLNNVTKIATSFDDMPNDLDFNDHAAHTQLNDDIAAQRFVKAPKAPSEFKEPCTKCRGTGRWSGGTNSYGQRECFACKGAGFLTFKTSPEERAKARAGDARRRETAAQEKARDLATKREAWIAANAADWAWMQSRAHSFDFAASMVGALEQWGSLTPGQAAAVSRLAAADRVRDAERAAAKTAQASKPAERLDNLHRIMQRHAKFYAGDLTLSRRNADQLIWVKHANAEKVVGKIDNGVLTLWNRPGVDNKALRAVLDEFEGAPLQAAMKYGKLAGRCCSCGRELTNDGSIEAGIGPICATKFD